MDELKSGQVIWQKRKSYPSVTGESAAFECQASEAEGIYSRVASQRHAANKHDNLVKDELTGKNRTGSKVG